MKKIKFENIDASTAPTDLHLCMYEDRCVGIYVGNRYKKIKPPLRDWMAWRRLVYRINEIEGGLVRSKKI